MESSNQRKILLRVQFLLIVGAAFLLTPWSGFFAHLYLWLRILLSLLLLAGLAGAALGVKSLLILGKVGGWIFILYSFAETMTDPEDYWSAGKEYPIGAYFLSRLLILLAVATAILICFRRLGKFNRPKKSFPDPA